MNSLIYSLDTKSSIVKREKEAAEGTLSLKVERMNHHLEAPVSPC